MSDEQTTGGTTVTAENPAAPPPGQKLPPVMDVVPPPVNSSVSVGTPVTEAPPEEEEYMPVGEDIAKQIGAPEPAAESQPSQDGDVAAPGDVTPPPADEHEPKAETGDSPDELIEAEAKHEETAAPPPAVTKQEKPANPARAAVIGTVFITVLLAGLAVFAYLSTQK